MTADDQASPEAGRQARRVCFPSGVMSALVDLPVRYDLAESTCPSLRLDEIVDPSRLGSLRLDYGTSRGGAELRTLIGQSVGVTADQVITTAGAIEAMFLVAQNRCHGRTIVLTPCFPATKAVPEGLGSPVDTVSLSFDSGYRLPVDAVAAAVASDTTLVTIASPQNPSGVTFTDQELKDLVALVEERASQAIILVDETYRASTYGDAAMPAPAADLSPRVVTCGSLSKAHGAPGLRLGWLTSTDPEFLERLRNAKFLTSVACSTIDEELAVAVLRNSGQILRQRATRLEQALDELAAWVAEQPVDMVRPDGGALCCLRLREDRFDDNAVRSFYAGLGGEDLRVAPGEWFGEEGRVFRLGFGHLEPPDFTEALRRLAGVLARA